MANAEVLYAMMEGFKQALVEHTQLTAQRDELMQNKIDSLMLQFKETVEMMHEQEFLNNELKVELEMQKMLIDEKDAKIQEQEFMLNEMERDKCDLIAEIESQKLHMDEKDKLINDQSDMIQDHAELINDHEKCMKRNNRLRMENEGIRLKNNIAKNQIDNLRAEIETLGSKFRMSSIHSVQSQQRYLQIKELYQSSQKNWVEAIDVYFKQIEAMNEYIETLHAKNEQSTMMQLIEQSIEEGSVEEEETVRGLSPIPEEDEDAYVESDVENQEVTESEESTENETEEVIENEESMENEATTEDINEELAENEEDARNEELTEAESEESTENEELIENEEMTVNEEVDEIEEVTENEELAADDTEEYAENEKLAEAEELTENREISENKGLTENEDNSEYNNGASTSNAEIDSSKYTEADNCSTDCISNFGLPCDMEADINNEGIELNSESNFLIADSIVCDLIQKEKQDSGIYIEECENQAIDSIVEEGDSLNAEKIQENNLNTVLKDDTQKDSKKKSKKRGGQANKNKRSKHKYTSIMAIANY